MWDHLCVPVIFYAVALWSVLRGRIDFPEMVRRVEEIYNQYLQDRKDEETLKRYEKYRKRKG